MVLGGDQANEKLRYPFSELSSDMANRYKSLGKNVDVNAIRKAWNEKIYIYMTSQKFRFHE